MIRSKLSQLLAVAAVKVAENQTPDYIRVQLKERRKALVAEINAIDGDAWVGQVDAGCHVGLLLDWFCFDFRRLFWFVGGYKPGFNESV